MVSYSAQLLPSVTSVTRYGYTRQGVDISGQPGTSFTIRDFAAPSSFARATIRLIPTHNLVEDLTWTRGTHTFQFGTNLRWIRNNRSSFANSFHSYSINDGFCTGLCNSVPQSLPSFGYPAISGSLNPFKRAVYDRIGGSLVVSQDLSGSVGLVSSLSNAAGLLDYGGPACTVPPTGVCQAPRFSGSGSLPPVTNFFSVPAAGFPSTPASTFGNLGFAIDNRLRTPYAYLLDLSYGRELPAGFAVEVSYVSRLAHKLLTKADLGAPLIYLIDPVSRTNYAQAINQLFSQSQQGTLPVASVTPIPYFQNLFSNLADMCPGIPNCTATQRVYQLARGDFPSFTDSLSSIDTRLTNFSNLGRFTFFQPQFQSLPVWTNLGGSNFHALQVTTRRRFSRGLSVDFNYTWSRSIDNSSALENVARVTGQIADAFFPRNARSVSSFDLKHQMSANWIHDLPFGRGHWLGGNVPAWLNQIIGGWRNSGIIRWRGAFPFSLENGFNFPTNFFLTTPGTQICPIRANFLRSAPGGPSLFGNDAQVNGAFACRDFTASGSSGSRNTLRGVRFFNLDFALRKSFTLAEGHRLVFDWQAFNLTNRANFDDRTLRTNPDAPVTSFGRYRSLIGADERDSQARSMQFGLRYEF